MAGVNDILKTQEQWQQEGKGQGGDFVNYYAKTGDVVLFHYPWTGRDGDPFLETFLAHDWPASPGRQYGDLKFCPVESGYDVNFDCLGCREGIRTKPRFAQWMYVYNILHKQAPKDETLPMVEWKGSPYFNRTVNALRFWESSAWKDSPLNEIMYNVKTLLESGKTAQDVMWVLRAVGDSLDRRYKVAPEIGSGPMAPDIIEAIRPQLQPVFERLMDGIKAVPTAVVGAPAPKFVPLAGTTSAPAVAEHEEAAPAFAPAMFKPLTADTGPLPFDLAPAAAVVAPAPTPIGSAPPRPNKSLY